MFVQVTAKNVGGVFLRHSVERYSASTYTGVTNFWKQSGFLAHPVVDLSDRPDDVVDQSESCITNILDEMALCVLLTTDEQLTKIFSFNWNKILTAKTLIKLLICNYFIK